MKKTQTDVAENLFDEEEISVNQNVESEEIEDEDFSDDEDFEDEDEENQEGESSTVVAVDGTEESLAPFAKVIKAYLESLEDETLKAALDLTDNSYNLCAKYITEEVRKNAVKAKTCRLGVLSDAEGYKMMRDFFIDGTYKKMLEDEEKQKKEQAEKNAKRIENQRKAEEKRKAEEEKKRKAEEEEKRWKEFLSRPKEMESQMNPIELETLKNKHAKQGEFEF